MLPVSCQRCKQTTNSTQAFLLTCRGCSRSWHHRCHMPPIEDDELMQRLRATNAGDARNDLKSWTCRRCKKAASATPSVSASREPTASSESQDEWQGLAPVATTKQERDESPLGGHMRSDRPEAAQGRSILKKHARKLPQTDPARKDVDVQMRETTPPKLALRVEQSRPPDGRSSQDGGILRPADIASPEDVEMRVDAPPSIHPEVTLPLQALPSDAQVTPTPRAIVANARQQQASPADQTSSRPLVNQDIEDDDPEDLYGPRNVQLRIVRILPSLVEELREQRLRAAAEKEKSERAPLAPQWIMARHADDPLWKLARPSAQGRKGRKPVAKRLGDNGLNTNELLNYVKPPPLPPHLTQS